MRSNEFTPFEQKVYAACATIPRGEVRSYKWIAARIGRPNAYRAVGNALNKNRYPGMIPCHRVIRCDGSIGGFAHGPKAKMKLLKREGACSRVPAAGSRVPAAGSRVPAAGSRVPAAGSRVPALLVDVAV